MHFLDRLLERPPRHDPNPESIRISFKHLSHLRESILIRSRRTGHTHDVTGLWLKPQGQVHRAVHIHLRRHACHVWRQRPDIHLRRALHPIHHRHSGENLIAMPEDEAQREAGHWHDQINLSPRITLPQITCEIGFMLRRREPGKIKILGEPLHLRCGRGCKGFPQTLLCRTDRGQIQPLAIKNQHIFFPVCRLIILCHGRFKSAAHDNAEQYEKPGIPGKSFDAALVHE